MSENYTCEAIEFMARKTCENTPWRLAQVARSESGGWFVTLEHQRGQFMSMALPDTGATPASASRICAAILAATAQPLAFANFDHGDPAPMVTISAKQLRVPGKRRGVTLDDFEVGARFTVTMIDRDTGKLTLTYEDWPWSADHSKRRSPGLTLVKPKG